MKLYEPAPPARKDELTNVQDGIAVIVDGDTCPVVVESGMYAYIKNNTHGLAEGLYKNISNSAFPTSGGTADGTVFEADNAGGLNALNASLTANALGTVVNIESYNLSSNLYTIPYDGYIKLTADGGVGNYSSFFVGSLRLGLARTYDGGNASFSTVYVRAGMQIYVDKTNSVYCKAEYVPFN